MDSIELKIGDIVQINPEHPNFPGQLLVVTEPKSWGCQGRLYMDTEIDCFRFEGRAYLRVKWEDMAFVGRCEWVWGKSEETSESEKN